MSVIDDFIKTIQQVPANALNDLGNIVNGIGQIPQTVNNAIQNPQSIPSTVGKIAGGVANEFNQFAGNPIKNTPLLGIQTPEQSAAQTGATIQHAVQHPVNTALDVASLMQGANPTSESSIGNTVEKTGKAMTNDVNKIQLPPSLGGAAREQAVQDTVNNIVPGATAEEKYANLLPTMKSLSDNIDTELTNNPKSVPTQDVKNAFLGNLSDQFRTKSLTSAKAAGEIDDYINNLFKDTAEPIPENTTGSPYTPQDPSAPSTTVGTTVNGSKFVRMGGVKAGVQGPPGYLKEIQLPPITNDSQYAVENPTSPYNPQTMQDIIPNNISTKDLFQMKVGANQDYQSVLRKMNSGQSLSDTDKVIAAARKTLDDIIAFEHPNVKSMTLQQSNLYDAISPLAGARNANHSFNFLGTTVPSGVGEIAKSTAGNALVNTGKTISKINPEKSLVLAGDTTNALGSSSFSPQNISNENDNEQSNYPPDHGGTISNNVNNVKSGVQSRAGRYAMQTPQTQGFLNTNDYTNQQNALTQQIAQAQATGNTVQESQLTGKLQQINNSWNNQKPIRDEGTKLNTAMGAANGAFNIIQKAPISLLNLNGSYDKLLNSTNPQYAALGSTLQNIQKLTGIDLSSAKTKEALVGKLDAAMEAMQNDYNGQVQQYFGGNTLNSTPNATQTNLPPIQNTQQTSLPSIGQVMHYNTGFGSAGQGLPPIQ